MFLGITDGRGRGAGRKYGKKEEHRDEGKESSPNSSRVLNIKHSRNCGKGCDK